MNNLPSTRNSPSTANTAISLTQQVCGFVFVNVINAIKGLHIASMHFEKRRAERLNALQGNPKELKLEGFRKEVEHTRNALIDLFLKSSPKVFETYLHALSESFSAAMLKSKKCDLDTYVWLVAVNGVNRGFQSLGLSSANTYEEKRQRAEELKNDNTDLIAQLEPMTIKQLKWWVRELKAALEVVLVEYERDHLQRKKISDKAKFYFKDLKKKGYLSDDDFKEIGKQYQCLDSYFQNNKDSVSWTDAILLISNGKKTLVSFMNKLKERAEENKSKKNAPPTNLDVFKQSDEFATKMQLLINGYVTELEAEWVGKGLTETDKSVLMKRFLYDSRTIEIFLRGLSKTVSISELIEVISLSHKKFIRDIFNARYTENGDELTLDGLFTRCEIEDNYNQNINLCFRTLNINLQLRDIFYSEKISSFNTSKSSNSSDKSRHSKQGEKGKTKAKKKRSYGGVNPTQSQDDFFTHHLEQNFHHDIQDLMNKGSGQ